MGADPARVRTRADLARELDLLRGAAARGTGRTRVPLADLAKRAAVPRSTLHTYLTGQTLPPADVLDRIVIALGEAPADQGVWGDAWDRVAAHEHEARRGASGIRPVPRQLPPDITAFTGRHEQLRALDDLLADGAGSRTAVLSAIAGTAGAGKTALAVHWAHRVADRFPDGQIHLNLRGHDASDPVDPGEAAAVALRALGITEIPSTVEERASALRSALADRRVLVLLDNAGSAEQVRHLLPGTGDCFTVVTSRDRLVGLSVLDGAHPIDLDVLTGTEGLDLLRHVLGDRVDDEHEAAVDLVHRCARLPLALRVAAEFARSGPLRDVVACLDRDRLDVLDGSGDPRTMVRAVFSWSHRALPADVAEAFRLIGAHPGRDFDVPAVAALTGSDHRAATAAIDHLVRVNLVRDKGSGRYDCHDLLREYSRELAAGEPAAATGRLLDHYVATTAAACAIAYPPHDGPPLPDWLSGPDAARDWLTAEAENLPAVVELAAAGGHTDAARELARSAARHLHTTTRWPQAMRAHRAALAAATAAADPAGEAAALRNMGAIADLLGEHRQALGWLERCARLDRARGDDHGLAATLNLLGATLGWLSRFDDAVAAFEESIELSLRAGETYRAAMSGNNLALVLRELGRLDRALALHHEALAEFRAAGDTVAELHTLTGAGAILALLDEHDEHDEATAQLDRARAGCRELGSLLGEAVAVVGLGIVATRRGDHALAVERFTEVLTMTRRAGETRLRSEVLNLLGSARCGLGDRAGARDAHQDALALARDRGNRLAEARALEGIGRAAEDGAEARRFLDEARQRYAELRVPDADRLSAER